MKTKVHHGQNFLDKVLECTGSIENAFEMALMNNISVTANLEIGRELKAPGVTKKAVANYFTEDNRPATGAVEGSHLSANDYKLPGELPYSF